MLNMRKFCLTGIVLKVSFLAVFYFSDLAMISSGNVSSSRILRSEHTQSISSRLKNEFSEIESFEALENRIAFLLNRFDMKGASVAVAREGRLVYARGIGYADLEAEELAGPGHMFRVASVSKLITAITIMKMKESGLLDLEDRVFGREGILNDSIYLDYTDRRVENITVRQLLNHSAGWSRRFGDHMFMNHHIARAMDVDGPVNTSDIIRFALNKRLHYNPGSGTSYSNLGYAILGEVISGITGMSYEDYVRKSILLPLGIVDMRLGKNLEAERFDNEVKYYEQSNAFTVNSIYDISDMVLKSYGGNDIETLGAAGGWIASAAELLRLVVAVDGQNDVPHILSQESIDLMTDYGLSGGQLMGWTDTDRQGNYWRTGTFAGTSALVMRQNNGLTWAVLFNSSTYRGTTLAREIRRQVQPALNNIEHWPHHDLFYYAETFPALNLIMEN
jgi:CubicO group peptidase (beta-lactamase class C family)